MKACQLTTTAIRHTLISVPDGRPRPPHCCTHAMTPFHLQLALSCQLCVHRTTLEPLLKVACTHTRRLMQIRARAMRAHYRTASAPLLH